ncbi:MAG: hypothetical protein L0G99_14520, partial [Propionibacteriales bacterium]|nr:hypothetical protein [Propionibacteriales bacterium]
MANQPGRKRPQGRPSTASAHRRRGVRAPVNVAQNRQRSVLAVVLLVVVMAVGIGVLFSINQVSRLAEAERTDSLIFTDKVAVIGVADRVTTTPVDDELLTSRNAEVGAVLTAPRCSASAWASLSAGRDVSVDCGAGVNEQGIVLDWQDRQAEVRRSGGELGALAGAGSDCLSSVGDRAALAAVRPDGSTADQRSVDSFISADYASACPVTMIDAGPQSDRVISDLAG